MHRDIKPANILIQESCDLVICDFGLARYVEETDASSRPKLTEYVVTRWYRAPELVLSDKYTKAVDLWALGCIIGDLLGRKALFPGKDFKHQIELICEILGTPSEEDCTHVKSSRARRFLSKINEYEGVSFWKLFPRANPDAIDLMEKLLKFNPVKRLNVEQALEHRYLSGFYRREGKKKNGNGSNMGKFKVFDEEGVDENGISVYDLKKRMLKEIYDFRPDAGIFKSNSDLIPES